MSLSVADRIVLHMGRFENYGFNKFEMPYELTQDGIGSFIGKTRAHVSIEMKKLQERDIVGWGNAHVSGLGKMRKAYYLTVKGHTVLEDLRKQMVKEGLSIEEISYGRIDKNEMPLPEMEMAYRKMMDATEEMYKIKGQTNPNTINVVDCLMDAIRLMMAANRKGMRCSVKDQEQENSKVY